MKCVKCSTEVPSHSRFCLRCGTPLAAAGGTPQPLPNPTGAFASSAFPAKTPMNSKVIAAIAALSLLCLGLLGWTISSQFLQKADKSGSGSMVNAPTRSGASGTLVQAPVAVNPGAMVQAPVTVAPVSPPLQSPAAAVPDHSDIESYLRFVGECELTKQGLISKELANALKSYGTLTPNEAQAATSDEDAKRFLPKVSEDSGKASEDWNNLTKLFLARQPPQDCVDIHDKYWDHLGKVQGMFTKLNNAVADAQHDSSKAIDALTGMLGTSSSEADQSALLADNALAEVCKRNSLEKKFTIKTDAGSASMIR